MAHGWWCRLVVVLGVGLLACPSGAQDTTHAAPPPPAPDSAPVDTSRVPVTGVDGTRRAQAKDSLRRAAARDSVQNAVTCEGRRITNIAVRPQPPFVGESNDPRVGRLLRGVSRLHTTTRPAIIRRFLAFKAGDICVERRRAESERLLRAQPFLQSARITAYADGPDEVRLDVFTVDALSGQLGVGFQNQHPLVDQLRLGSSNFLGRAVDLSAGWAHTRGYRDRFEGSVADFQTLGRPWVLTVDADRDHVGGDVQAALSHPYFTDLQTIGWRVAGGSDHDYIQFREVNVQYYPTLDLERAFANAGGLIRLGTPAATLSDDDGTRHNRLALVGLALSHESNGIGGGPVLLTSSGLAADTTAATAQAFRGRYAYQNVDRVNALFGIRSVGYVTVRGFDALLGEQDVPRGAQVAAVVGRGLSWFNAARPDLFLSGRLDAAAGGSRSLVRGGVDAEVRRDDATASWNGLIVSGRLSWYFKPSLSQTMTVSTDGAFGDRATVPFQLALGDPTGGVRGFIGSSVAGAARIVERVEYRTLFRPPLRLLRAAAGWAVAGFVDGGRVWAGDVPFGTTSPFVAGAGVGLLVTVPAASRQVWRVDIAAPLVRQPRAGWGFRLSSSNSTRVWWTEPADVARSREQTVTPSLFSYP